MASKTRKFTILGILSLVAIISGAVTFPSAIAHDIRVVSTGDFNALSLFPNHLLNCNFSAKVFEILVDGTSLQVESQGTQFYPNVQALVGNGISDISYFTVQPYVLCHPQYSTQGAVYISGSLGIDGQIGQFVPNSSLLLYKSLGSTTESVSSMVLPYDTYVPINKPFKIIADANTLNTLLGSGTYNSNFIVYFKPNLTFTITTLSQKSLYNTPFAINTPVYYTNTQTIKPTNTPPPTTVTNEIVTIKAKDNALLSNIVISFSDLQKLPTDVRLVSHTPTTSTTNYDLNKIKVWDAMHQGVQQVATQMCADGTNIPVTSKCPTPPPMPVVDEVIPFTLSVDYSLKSGTTVIQHGQSSEIPVSLNLVVINGKDQQIITDAVGTVYVKFPNPKYNDGSITNTNLSIDASADVGDNPTVVTLHRSDYTVAYINNAAAGLAIINLPMQNLENEIQQQLGSQTPQNPTMTQVTTVITGTFDYTYQGVTKTATVDAVPLKWTFNIYYAGNDVSNPTPKCIQANTQSGINPFGGSASSGLPTCQPEPPSTQVCPDGSTISINDVCPDGKKGKVNCTFGVQSDGTCYPTCGNGDGQVGCNQSPPTPCHDAGGNTINCPPTGNSQKQPPSSDGQGAACPIGTDPFQCFLNSLGLGGTTVSPDIFIGGLATLGAIAGIVVVARRKKV